MNSFVFKEKFKCEDLSVAIQIFDKGFYLLKFDLITSQVIIKSRFFLRIASSLRSLGISELDYSGIFSLLRVSPVLHFYYLRCRPI